MCKTHELNKKNMMLHETHITSLEAYKILASYVLGALFICIEKPVRIFRQIGQRT